MTAKESDVRFTPEWILALAREMFGGRILLDAATHPSNPTQATRYFCGEQSDALAGESGLVEQWDYQTWCNPPFSQMQEWCNKALLEARAGAEILFMTTDDPSTRWYRFLTANADARCRLKRRAGFSVPLEEGTVLPMGSPRWCTSIWYWGHQRRRFARIFGPHGEMLHGLGPREQEETVR